MKRILIVCTVMFFSGFGFAQNNSGKYSYDDLKPSETQHRVEQFVTQF